MLQRVREERPEAERAEPEMDIYILYRDMMTYGFKEDYYREASNKDVKFIRYEPQDKPQVEAVEEDGRPV
jgi:heterodisulfide reductase subunit A2